MIRQYLAHVQADTSFLLKSDQQGKEDLINIECRVLACALSRSADIEAVLDDIFRPAKDTVTRSLHYKSIARAMRANISNAAAKKALETRLLAVVEQLSNFLAAVQSDDEAAAVLEMTRVLLQFEDESFHTRFERIIPRVCAAALALIAADKAQFGFLILQCVLSSNYRSFCQQSFSAIRNASFEYLCSPGACDLSADCAALTVIADTAENWIGYWKSYVFTGITLIQSMGIAMNVSLPKSSKPIREMALRSQSGAGKALFCERMLRGCFKGMERMLYHGCATGPVCTELSGLFICCQAVMAVHMDAFGNTDPKALIENESGVSMVDVSLVITNIKTYFLEFISTLLAVTPPTTLYPVAGYICRSVATAVSSKDFASSNRFSLAVLHSVSDVISAFPTAVIKTGLFADAVIGMFKAQIRQLSAMPKADDFEEWKAEMAMKTTKQLLLFCGSILSSEQRNVIEYCIAVALSCLAKGVCSSSCAVVDRKVRRVGCMDKSGISIGSANGRLIEPIRYSIEAQLALLDLATTDVLSPRSVGTLSGNISLLKLVAEVISNHPSAQCRAEARVTLSVIDSILHPSAVPLPAIAMSTLIRSHLAEKDMTNDEAMNTSMGIIGFNQFSTAPAELANQDLFRADTSGFDASHDLPRTEEPAVAAVSVQSLENFSAMNAPFKVKSALITGSSATVTGVKRALPLESADSDDDIDLPDIV